MSNKRDIIIVDNASELSARGAAIFFKRAKEVVDHKGRFSVALSGGSTPRGMHKLLAEEPYLSRMPWGAIELFWVDERCVPVDDPASNYGVAKEDFVNRIPIPPANVHPMPGEVPPEEGAGEYQRQLEEFFQLGKGASPVFDIIFLGMGTDGHTASLFPGANSVGGSGTWVEAVKGGIPDVYRLTLTYEVLNRAKEICFLVAGKEKALTVRAIFEDREANLPAQKIQLANGKLTWLLDKEAASFMSKEMIHGSS